MDNVVGREIFTTGFPRSGSTWTVRTLCDLFDAVQQDTPESPESSEFAVDGVRPDYILRKTHWYHYQYPGRGYNGPSKMVWVSRDPRDMVISVMHYRGQTDVATVIKSIEHKGDDKVGIDAMVNGWLDHPPDFHLTYEDMHERPKDILRQLYRLFTGTPVNESKLAKVVVRNNFENMTKRFPHPQALRKGITGDWRNFFSYDDAVLMESIHGPLLRRLGYTNGPNWVEEFPDEAVQVSENKTV